MRAKKDNPEHESASDRGNKRPAGLVRKHVRRAKLSSFWRWRRTRRLVLGPSTRAEIADIVAGLENHGWRSFSGLGHFAIDLIEVSLHPSHA